MKRNRIIAIFLFILSVVGISYYGGPVSYGFFFLMLFAPIVSLIYLFIVFWRFKIYQRLETRTAVVNKPAVFYFTLQNEDFFSYSGIRAEFFSDFSTIGGLDGNDEYELTAHSGISRETILICKYRGEYDAGIRYVYVTDYLRLFTIRFRNRETLKVTVLPDLVFLNEIRYMDEMLISTLNTKRASTEPDVLVRNYVPGDDIRNIHWMATAKTGKPLIRERIGENTPGITLIMDSCRYSDNAVDFLPLENKILEVVLAISHYCTEHGISTSVCAYNRQLTRYYPRGEGAFDEFYSAMAAFIFDAASDTDRLFYELSAGTNDAGDTAVVMVLHEWSRSAAVYAERLEKNSIPVLVYLITDRSEDTAGGSEGAVLNTGKAQRIRSVQIGYSDKLEEVL